MGNEETVGQRFTQLISYLGISKNAFATSLDKTATVIQHLVDERNKPGFDLLCKVFDVYPNVSKDWLLQGVGPMLYPDSKNVAVEEDHATEQAQAAPTSKTLAAVVPAAATSSTLEAPAALAPEVAAAPRVADSEPAAVAASHTPAASPITTQAAPDTSWQTALYTQQMAHQLAMAELRNQHLQEQQRLMQQMMDLMQRQFTR